MKRLLVLFAVLVPLSLFIAGCGGTGGSSGKAVTPEKTQQMQEMMKAGKAKMMEQAKGGGATGEAEKK